MVEDLIYDVGMNNGDDTAFYLSQGYQVVAIEADPYLCDMVSRRFRSAIREGRLLILQVGIAETSGVSEFFICEKKSEWNSFDKKVASRDGLPHHSIRVPCQTFEWVLENYGVPYYLKIDIEGNDHLCLIGLDADRDLPKYVSAELGDFGLMLARLSDLGYSRYKLISQSTLSPLELAFDLPVESRRPWLYLITSSSLPVRIFRRILGRGGQNYLRSLAFPSRRLGGWVFPWGSSGPFGADTPGRWLNEDEVSGIHEHFFDVFGRKEISSFWTKRDYSFWVDLHAMRDD